MLDGAGGDHHHAFGGIVAVEIVVDLARGEGLHRLRRAEDRAADRLVGGRRFPRSLSKTISSGVSCAAPISCRMTCCSRSSSSGSNSESVRMSARMSTASGTSSGKHAGVVGGRLDAGRGVDLAADILDLLGDLAGGAARRALEGHVLEQVRDAVLVVALVSRAGLDPDPERDAFRCWQGFRLRPSCRSTDGLPQHPYRLYSLTRPLCARAADVIFHHL